MPDWIEEIISQLKLRLIIGGLLRKFTPIIAIFAMAFGLAVLLSKLFLYQLWPTILWSGILLPAILAWIAVTVFTNGPSREKLISILDHRAGCNGLLMTIAERGNLGWISELPAADDIRNTLPAVVPDHILRATAIPIMFMAAAIALPSGNSETEAPEPSLIYDVTSDLTSTISLLQSTGSLDPTTAIEMAGEISQIKKDLRSGKITDESWAGVDALRNRLQGELTEDRQALSQLANALRVGKEQSSNTAPVAPTEPIHITPEMELALKQLSQNKTVQSLATQFLNDLPETSGHNITPRHLEALLNDPQTRQSASSAIAKLVETKQFELNQSQYEMNEMLGISNRVSESFPEIQAPDDDEKTNGPWDLTKLADVTSKLGATAKSQATDLSQLILPTTIFSTNTPGESESQSTEAPPASPQKLKSPKLTGKRSIESPEPQSRRSSTWRRQIRPQHLSTVQKYFSADKEL